MDSIVGAGGEYLVVTLFDGCRDGLLGLPEKALELTLIETFATLS